MRCIFCGNFYSKVLDSRPNEEGYAIRRRRECLNCKKRFTTYEKIENRPLIVLKKSEKRDIFDREKLLKGILKACEKTKVSLKEVEAIVLDIEKELLNSFEKEIRSEIIGDMVMNKLKKINTVAYVRFASVYREFKDVETFKLEIENLLKKNKNNSRS